MLLEGNPGSARHPDAPKFRKAPRGAHTPQTVARTGDAWLPIFETEAGAGASAPAAA